MMDVGTISVACMTNDEPVVILRFLSSLRRIGVEQIFLYLDGVAEKLSPQFSSLPNVVVTTTSEVFAGRGTEHKVQYRQMACYRDAYYRSSAGWIGFLDTDEEIFSELPLRRLFENVKRDFACVRLEVREVAWLSGESTELMFSGSIARGPLPFTRGFTQLLPMEVEQRLRRATRINGHSEGKYFVRCGLEKLAPSIHFCRSEMILHLKESAYRLQSYDVLGLYCLHHDALSYSRWISKMRHRAYTDAFGALSKERNEQLVQFLAAELTGKVRELFDLQYQVELPDFNLAQQLGLAFRIQPFT